MKTQHTPGPWHLIGSRDSGFTVHGNLPDGAGDTDIIAVCRNISRDTNEANAKLIAAAPDLLEALQALIASSCAIEEAKFTATDDALTCLEGRLERAIDQARAAIALAANSEATK